MQLTKEHFCALSLFCITFVHFLYHFSVIPNCMQCCITAQTWPILFWLRKYCIVQPKKKSKRGRKYMFTRGSSNSYRVSWSDFFPLICYWGVCYSGVIITMASNEAVLVENAVSKLYYLQLTTTVFRRFLNEHFQLVQFHLKPSMFFNYHVVFYGTRASF